MQLEQYQRFYGSEDRHWWFLGMRRIFTRIIKNIYGDQTNLEILDVGCGTGMIMQDLKKFGQVVGVDNQTAALEFCQLRKIDQVCLADGLNLPFKDGRFDLVTVFNVVEHIQDDAAFILELSRVCKNKGRIILSTSAFNLLWSRHDQVNQHKRRYTKNRLRALINEQRLCVERITYTNCILFPFILAATVWENIRPSFCGSLLDRYYSLPKSINKLLYLVLKLEELILRLSNFPLGVSLLCVAQKKLKN